MSYMYIIELGISKLENLLNSKECHNFLGVTQNNISKFFYEILMQVIDLMTVVVYHTLFYVRYSYWCQSVFDRGDKH